MISLIAPYWNRQGALLASLEALAAAYPLLDMEVLVIDDGSPEPAVVEDAYPWPVRVIRLPDKTAPKDQCVPQNVGLKESRGDYVVMTCCEVLHTDPVLEEMRAECERIGPKAYVLAAAWCPEESRWHTHTTCNTAYYSRVPQPAGWGWPFCGMIRRDFLLSVGGHSEDYRDGAGYSDCDLVWKLYDAGGQCVIRDDLVVIHPRTGASTTWPDGAFNRNRQIYFDRWSHKTWTM